MSELPKARITVVEKIYYQKHDGSSMPSLIESNYLDPVQSDKQPYVRHLPLSVEWKKLDFGWIEKPGLIHIKNRGADPGFTIPDDEKRRHLAGLTVEVCFGITSSQHALLIPPGRSVRFYYKEEVTVWLRCSNGDTQLEINVFPR